MIKINKKIVSVIISAFLASSNSLAIRLVGDLGADRIMKLCFPYICLLGLPIWLNEKKVMMDSGAEYGADLKSRPVNLYMENGNLVYSPLSLNASLIMVANGASDSIKRQVAKYLNFSSFEEANEWLKKFMDNISKSKDVSVLNSMWLISNNMRSSYVKEKFSDVMKRLKSDVFSSHLDSAHEEINKWVASKTYGKINNLIEDRLSDESAIVLVNTIYLKLKFLEEMENDSDDLLFCEKEKKHHVKSMYGNRTANYFDNGVYQAVELPLEGGFSAYVILPNDSKNLNQVISLQTMKDLRKSMKPQSLYLKMPQFNMESSLDFTEYCENDPLLKGLFNCGFPGINDKLPLKLSRIIQKIKIGVNHKGVEAAAATFSDVILEGYTEPLKKQMIVDRPFGFIVAKGDDILFKTRIETLPKAFDEGDGYDDNEEDDSYARQDE